MATRHAASPVLRGFFAPVHRGRRTLPNEKCEAAVVHIHGKDSGNAKRYSLYSEIIEGKAVYGDWYWILTHQMPLYMGTLDGNVFVAGPNDPVNTIPAPFGNVYTWQNGKYKKFLPKLKDDK